MANKIIRIIALGAVLFITTVGLGGEAEDKFAEANRLYREENFSGAHDLYLAMLDSGYESGELYYNLGNACFKIGDLGGSILYYEKARILLPRDKDLEHNLRMAQMRVADRVEVPRLAIWKFLDTLRDYLPMNLLSGATLAGFLLFLAIFAAYYFLPKGGLKKSFFYLSLPFFIIFLVLAMNLSLRIWRLENIREGVLLAEKVEVLAAPDEDGKGLFSLHEGVKFRIVQELPPWSEIALPDGKKGWIRQDSFAEI